MTSLALVAWALTGCSATGRPVTRAEFGDAWPLTVDSGTVHCRGTDSVTFETGGVIYDVTGADEVFGSGFGEPIEPIWARDANGALKDLAPLELAGNRLCP
jgi:hypothetical protein